MGLATKTLVHKLPKKMNKLLYKLFILTCCTTSDYFCMQIRQVTLFSDQRSVSLTDKIQQADSCSVLSHVQGMLNTVLCWAVIKCKWHELSTLLQGITSSWSKCQQARIIATDLHTWKYKGCVLIGHHDDTVNEKSSSFYPDLCLCFVRDALIQNLKHC